MSCWSIVIVSAIALATSQPPVGTDPRCPPHGCCDTSSSTGGRSPNLEGCEFEAPWTFAYCCAQQSKTDCYRWGEDALGHDIADFPSVVSGVSCRHICQAQEHCAFWAFLVDVPELGDLRSRCFLKSQAALTSKVQSHRFVVSGDRICEDFAEGMPLSQARLRISGLQTARPWRTATSREAAEAAMASGHIVLPAAGTVRWYREAAEVFSELGFVAVLGAVTAKQAHAFKVAADTVASTMLARDPHRLGNRGPRRYSFGGASSSMHMTHVRPWAELFDIDAVNSVLQAIYPGGYVAAGGGGDFVLGNTDTFQSLHVDLAGPHFHSLDRPPAVVVNFVVEDLFCAAGPVRVIPGSQWQKETPPTLSEEPLDAKGFIICPLPAGSVIIRDLRTWHGGTPNALSETRHLPNAEFIDAEWSDKVCGRGGYLDPCSPILPLVAHARLSAFGQAVTKGIVDRSGAVEEVDPSAHSWLVPDFAQITRQNEGAY